MSINNININWSSELMDNYHMMDVIDAAKGDKIFQAVQTKDGHALFFAIGTSGEFNLLHEKPIIKELHLGGGSPTYLSSENLKAMLTPILSKTDPILAAPLFQMSTVIAVAVSSLWLPTKTRFGHSHLNSRHSCRPFLFLLS